MSDHSKPHESLHVRVAQEFAQNYRSFLNRKKHQSQNRSAVSKLREIYAEELEAAKQHPRTADTVGFN